jgi:hypothetical protein
LLVALSKFEDSDVCYCDFALMLMVILFLQMQIRTLHSLPWLSAASDIAIILAMVLAGLVRFCLQWQEWRRDSKYVAAIKCKLHGSL